MDIKMNKIRLLILAKFLDTVPEHKFDLNSWRTTSVGVSLSFKNGAVSNKQLANMDCGTAGCAVGWACAIPEFQAQGLTWNEKGRSPEFLDYWSWIAVEAFFELSASQSAQLFEAERYREGARGPKDVAGAIRNLVA
jgi:hypothetical protein